MKIVYIGTPDYVVPPMDAVLDAGHEVPMVITPPDVVSGRGQTEEAPPLKKAALERGLHVYQPNSINDPSAVERISREEPDLLVVASFGKILRPGVLSVPELDAINIHPSCLPEYRGPAPVAHSILDGCEETCVTIFRMNEEMDRGPIIDQKTVPIQPEETTGGLRVRLFKLAAERLSDVIEQFQKGTIHVREQDPDEGSYAPFLSREDGRIDWHRSASYIFRQVRAMKPWPETFSWLVMEDRSEPLRTKIIWGKPDEERETRNEPGEIISVTGDGLEVETGEGVFVIDRVQPENSKEMKVSDFVNGYQPEPGDRFQTSPGQ